MASNGIEITVRSDEITQLAGLFRHLTSAQIEAVNYRAVKHTGDKALTQVRRAVAKQTGAKYGAVKAAVVSKATYGEARYVIFASGGYIPLKEFGAKSRMVMLGNVARKRSRPYQVVTAAPWNQRRQFPGMFIVPSNGHVFIRAGARRVMTKGTHKGQTRQPITKRWGPAIPNEMIQGESRATFYASVEENLIARIAHELGRELDRIGL